MKSKSPDKFKLPKDTNNTISSKWNECENLGLKIQKFVPFTSENGEKVDKPKNYDVFDYRVNIQKVVLEEYKKYFNLQKELWEFSGAKVLKISNYSRLVVGLGDESVYETSIRLLRNYGIPYIPGSALKGVTKHWAILETAESLQDMENIENDFFDLVSRVQKSLDNPARNENDKEKVKEAIAKKLGFNPPEGIFKEMAILRTIFGTQNQEGGVVFFDAILSPESIENNPVLELDVMAPHYQPYYSSEESKLNESENAPGDWHDPKPIPFFTVPKGIIFHFPVASRDRNTNLVSKARDLLIEALKEHGVGAKTSLGYGRFK